MMGRWISVRAAQCDAHSSLSLWCASHCDGAKVVALRSCSAQPTMDRQALPLLRRWGAAFARGARAGGVPETGGFARRLRQVRVTPTCRGCSSASEERQSRMYRAAAAGRVGRIDDTTGAARVNIYSQFLQSSINHGPALCGSPRIATLCTRGTSLFSFLRL